MELKRMMAGGLLAAGMMVLAPVMAGTLPDHEEFEAALHVPFQAAGARTITLHFSYPGAAQGTPVAWEVELLGPNGAVVRSWQGQGAIRAGGTQAQVAWDGRDASGHTLAPGYYTVHMRAVALDANAVGAIGTGLPQNALAAARSKAPQLIEEQRYDVLIGSVAAPQMPHFTALRHTGSASAGPMIQAQSV